MIDDSIQKYAAPENLFAVPTWTGIDQSDDSLKPEGTISQFVQGLRVVPGTASQWIERFDQ